MRKEDFIPIGKFTKYNRKTGALSLISKWSLPEKFEEEQVIFLEIDGGMVPFFPESISITGKTSAILSLEDYNTPEKAARLVGLELFLPREFEQYLNDEERFFEQITEFEVVDPRSGFSGKIRDIIRMPLQILLRVEQQGDEILIPFAEDWIVSVNYKKKQIQMNLPEGLTELNKT